jgi:AraC-like DNA-binding protein
MGMGATQINLRDIQIIGRQTREWVLHQRECPALAACGILFVGVTHAMAGYTFCRIKPEMAVVFAVFRGAGQVWAAGRWQRCGRNATYLAPAGTPHAYRAIRGPVWGLAWVVYEEEYGSNVLRESQAHLGAGSAESLRDPVMGLYREAQGHGDKTALQHWAELVDLSARRLAQERQLDERLVQLWSNIDMELGRPWTLATLAARAHVGTEHLRFLCRRDYGRSPMAYLAWLRMKRAAYLLEHSNRKISVVAEEVGYQNAFAFSTAFKRVMRTSPREFSGRKRRLP